MRNEGYGANRVSKPGAPGTRVTRRLLKPKTRVYSRPETRVWRVWFLPFLQGFTGVKRIFMLPNNHYNMA